MKFPRDLVDLHLNFEDHVRGGVRFGVPPVRTRINSDPQLWLF